MKTYFFFLVTLLVLGLLVIVLRYSWTSSLVEGQKITVLENPLEKHEVDKKEGEGHLIKGERKAQVASKDTSSTSPIDSKENSKEKGELRLFDFLTRETFKSIPGLLEDLRFTHEEIETVRRDSKIFQELGRLQKRSEHAYYAIDAKLSGKGTWNLYLMDKNPKAFLDAKKMTFQDPKDKNRYLELVVFNGKKLGHKKVFIRIDAFPEMKRLREAQTHLVKRFTEDVRKRVRKFLKGKVPNVRKR